MEYHKDRFLDSSLVILKDNRVVGILPGHTKEDVFYSHLGLTYGGLILSSNIGSENIEEVFNLVIAFLKQKGIKKMYIKVIPSFLQENYGSAFEYLIFQKGGILKRRDLNFIIDLSKPVSIHKSKRKKINSIDEHHFKIVQSNDFKPFWDEVLKPTLQETYNVDPVHSLTEIELLKTNFPDHILQYDVYHENNIIAGMTLFIDNGVVKSQYGAANKLGKSLRALDYLYNLLFNLYQEKNFRYFDLGTTTTDKGYNYNRGLSRYKEELGAHPVNIDHYSLTLT